MKLEIYRKLYLANRGLLQAVHALSDLRRDPAFRDGRINRIQMMIEETRALMNRVLAEQIEEREKNKAATLGQLTRQQQS